MTQQLYKLVRSVIVTGTPEELDAYERVHPVGNNKLLGETISNVGVRQLITGVKVPEPPTLPEIPGTTKKGT